MREIALKYGCNPYQKPARIYTEGPMPLTVLNGRPGYINFMDALNSWQLVRELRQVLQLPSAASFKHVSPAGAGLGLPLNDTLARACMVEGLELSPLAQAYARARGGDRISSFGDWIALSDVVDEATALLIKKDVSDGVIAPGYTKTALTILQAKQQGAYNIVQIDPSYEPAIQERRSIFGIMFEQQRNNLLPTVALLENVVTANNVLPESAKRDLLLAMLTLKYTQSNSVCYVLEGQVIGNGAGQQSRIHCTRLAGDKADLWYLRQHPMVLKLRFKEGVTRTQKDIVIDQYLGRETTQEEMRGWGDLLTGIPPRLTEEDKAFWLKGLQHVALGSDAFFPQRDNIDRACKSGVKYIAQPGGSTRDDIVIEACNAYEMVMAFTGTRLFHH